MNWRDHITTDPNVCHGKACIRGTRVMVSAILDNLAANASVSEIVASYPPITADDVRAALAYAAVQSIEKASHERGFE